MIGLAVPILAAFGNRIPGSGTKIAYFAASIKVFKAHQPLCEAIMLKAREGRMACATVRDQNDPRRMAPFFMADGKPKTATDSTDLTDLRILWNLWLVFVRSCSA